MLRSDLWHRSPFSLTRGETRRLNREIVANAAKSAFERPSDEIIESSEVPCRRPTAEPEYSTLTVDDAIDLMRRLATQKSRWTGIESPPLLGLSFAGTVEHMHSARSGAAYAR